MIDSFSSSKSQAMANLKGLNLDGGGHNRQLRMVGKVEMEQVEFNPCEILNRVERAILGLATGSSDNPGKLMGHAPDDQSVGYAHLARDGELGLFGFKVNYKFAPEAPRHVQKDYNTILLFDDRTGEPVAFMDCGLVGAIRTAAVSALMAREACRHASSALIIGTGTQGRMAAPFLFAALPNLERVIVHGHHSEGIQEARACLRRFWPARSIESSACLQSSAGEVDLVVGAAGAAVPEVVHHESLRPGATAILLGYGIHPSVLSRADYCIATSEQQMRTTGMDLADAHGRLRIVDAELPEILAGRKPGRRSPSDLVFAYNSGLVLTDITVAQFFAQAALAQNRGQEVELW